MLIRHSCCQAQNTSLDNLFLVAKESIYKDEYQKAIEQFEACLLEAQKQNDTLQIGNAFIGIGIAYDKSGNYEEALGNYFKALRFYEAAVNPKKQAGTLKNIGNTYRTLKNYNKSHDYLQLALQQFETYADSTGISNVLNDLGIMYMDKGNHQQAISYFKQVIYSYKKDAKEEVQAFALNNIAVSYAALTRYTEAYQYYNASLNFMKKLKNKYGVAMVLGNIGDLFLKQGSYKKALSFSKQGMVLAEKLHSKELLVSAYQNMANACSRLHDFKQSHFYLEKQIALKDTIFKEESARIYAELEMRYQNEKKQKEISLLKKEKIITQRTKYFLFIIVAFIGLIAILIYRSYLIKQRANKELGILNSKLYEANSSKTKLLSILSHDLRSPISSLFSFLQMKTAGQNHLTKEGLEKYNQQISRSAENLLEAMEDLLIWSKSQMDSFFPMVERVNLSDFFDEVIQLNNTAAENKNIHLVKECLPNLNLNTDPNFLRIIFRNLLNNSIKFTPENGIIYLKACIQDTTCFLIVKDNGIGITANELSAIFEWNNIRSDSYGLGLKLVKEFTEKLQGSIKVQSQADEGTEFILSFSCN